MAVIDLSNLSKSFDPSGGGAGLIDNIGTDGDTNNVTNVSFFSGTTDIDLIGNYTLIGGIPQGIVTTVLLDFDNNGQIDFVASNVNISLEIFRPIINDSTNTETQTDLFFLGTGFSADFINFGNTTTAKGINIIYYGDRMQVSTGQDYNSAPDTMVGDIGTGGMAVGDVQTVFGRMVAGADTITVSGAGSAVGDAKAVVGGLLFGGNDTITQNGGAGDTFTYGDAFNVGFKGNLVGGDDTITVNTLGWVYGDTNVISAQGYVRGGNDNITGSAFDDRLYGDVGTVNDTAFVHGGSDTIHAGGGNDVIRGDYVTLNAGALGFVGGNDFLYGEAGNDLIYGDGDANSGTGGNDFIDGGTGADDMIGKRGNDTYVVDNVGDFAREDIADVGVDLVLSSVSITLATPVAGAARGGNGVENVTLTGSANINVTGFDIDNVLIGNSGNNVIDGGLGKDTMTGLAGNDVYGVRDITDVVDESVAGSAGIDKINSLVNVSLIAVSGAALGKGGVENISLVGSGNIFAYGNNLANVIIGNVGSNTIAAGLGNDTLTGAGGNDFFLFNTALNGTANVDTITDMNEAGNDTIRLENAIFTALTTTGALAAAAFAISTTGATDASDRIIYNNVNGQLSYDSNGNGAGGSVVFAQLDAGLALTAADFFVV